MKPGARIDENAADFPFPGRYRPGLIEAAAAALAAAAEAAFPGRYRPGLIEARGGGDDGNPAHPFRGVIAPASLKPGPAAGQLELIERAFRGVIAPASLKHDQIARLARDQQPFPGRYRPGLIEAVPGFRRRNARPAPFPGRYRPGLIEAVCRWPG